jgi:hypothetical protein
LAHCIWVSPGLGFGRVFDLAEHAAIALAAVRCFSSSVLAFRALTFWTSVHALILAQFLATPVIQYNPAPEVGHGKINRL